MGTPYVLYYTVSVSKSRMFEEYVSHIDYSTVPPTEILQNDVVIPEMILSGDANSYTATGLEPDTAYYFRFTACNAAGCSSVILGPYFTKKAANTDEERIRASYRQDPITGLVRIWWEQSSVPDRTVITLTPTTAYGGTYSFTEYEKTYTVQSVMRGIYTVVVRNFIGETVVASDTFEMIVHDFRVCDVVDPCGEFEDAALSTATVRAGWDDPIALRDAARCDLPITIDAHFNDTGWLGDDTGHEGVFARFCDAATRVSLTDNTGNLQNGMVLCAAEDSAWMFDESPPSSHNLVQMQLNDAPRFYDRLRVRHFCSVVSPVDALLLGEGTRLSVSVLAVANENVIWTDRGAIALSVNAIASDPLPLRDTPAVPGQRRLAVRESVRAYDLGDESSVGRYYDFSHIRGER